ncbi:MAG: (deoxy)nucleoside triphosphate pyrophosphohydrolase, partial [Erysipelotrichaceae bacterium]|nr:(deoxy)nucleoside triphosphate pyrophosphohydrolase [Erysipelotrichaceae bacterium]
MAKDKVIQVAAALIWDDDRFMICQRPAHKARGLLWEFPGGKLEAGEDGPAALIRECQEELDVTLAVDELYMSVPHDYPDIFIELLLYHARIDHGDLKLLEHVDLKWITPEEIDQYEFCPAD